ncbi:MAG: phosphotransferase family protein [Myxococcota bacterium]
MESILPDDVAPVRPDEQMDWPRLEDWLRKNVPDLEGAMGVAQFPGGHANLTYCVSFGGRELVVRRPPHGTIAPGAHDMRREYRVLFCLSPVFDRAPRVFGLCEDESVIGASFVVIERRRGAVVRTEIPESLAGHPDVERRLTLALVDAMVDLHRVDLERAGLGKLGRPAGFVARQVEGWSQRWRLATDEKNALFDELHRKLVESLPVSRQVSIVHNDFKLDNCMFAPENPDRVASIFDWDMATIGDPLVELGTLLSYWPRGPGGDAGSPTIDLDMSRFPERFELVERYAAASGFDIEELPWYEGFALWKLAVVLQQLYRRYQTGQSADERFARFPGAIPRLLESARDVLVSLA